MPWVKLWNRSHTLQQNWLGRFIWFRKNKYRLINNMMMVDVGKGRADTYFQKKEWDDLMRILAEEVLVSGYLVRARILFQTEKYKLLHAAQALADARALRRLGNRELLQRYRRLEQAHLSYTYFFWVPWAVNEVLVPQFEKRLQRIFGLKTGSVIFQAVIVPLQPIRMDLLLRGLARAKENRSLSLALPKLMERYGYLAVYSLVDKPYKAKYLRHLLATLGDPGHFLKHQQSQTRRKQARYRQALRRLGEYPALLRIAQVLSEFAWLRTERVDVWREVLYSIQPFYGEVEKRMSLKPGQGPYLTYHELIDFLGKGTVPRVKKIVPEKLLYLRKGKVRVIRDPGEAARILARELPKIAVNVQEVYGQVACVGHVQGTVRIVYSPADCALIKRGEILVANMTHPDYFIGMRRAAGIVTDEGGVSCHAAIVSRELGKPCIIGTKQATAIFKTGDKVELDAHKGVVRKL